MKVRSLAAPLTDTVSVYQFRGWGLESRATCITANLSCLLSMYIKIYLWSGIISVDTHCTGDMNGLSRFFFYWFGMLRCIMPCYRDVLW